MIRRRQFIQATAATLVCPGLFSAGPLLAATAGRVDAPFFFDDRFDRARRLAAMSSIAAIPVKGDVTRIWHEHCAIFDGATPMVYGITTDSFSFCLEVLARDQLRTRLDSARLDRDLFAWSLRMTPFDYKSKSS